MSVRPTANNREPIGSLVQQRRIPQPIQEYLPAGPWVAGSGSGWRIQPITGKPIILLKRGPTVLPLTDSWGTLSESHLRKIGINISTHLPQTAGERTLL